MTSSTMVQSVDVLMSYADQSNGSETRCDSGDTINGVSTQSTCGRLNACGPLHAACGFSSSVIAQKNGYLTVTL